MRSLRRALLVVGVAVATALADAGCAQGATSDGRIAVVAGENQWGSIVAQVGGDRVAVRSIIADPDDDPHEYASTAADAQAVASARLVVENGFGYDDFLGRLVDASPSADRTVLDVQRVLRITAADANPHIWYDTADMPAVASAVAAALARIQPAHAAEFRANAAKFDAALQPIESVIATVKQRYAGTSIAYTERVPGYLVEACGLRVGVPAAFTQAVEDGTDPSPSATAAFDTAVRTRSVKVLLLNDQVTDPQTTAIAKLATASGVPVVGVTETLPTRYPTYQAWQLAQARALLAALGG